MMPFEVQKLKHLTRLVQVKSDSSSPDLPFVGLENIAPWTGEICLGTESYPEGTVAYFAPGDILFGKLRPYLAKVALPDFAGTCSTEALVLRPTTNIHPRFLRYVLSSKEFIDEVDSSTYGSKMPRASWEFIGSRCIPAPDLATQKAIADFLDRETARIDQLIEKKQRLVKLLEEKRQATVRQLVFGQDRTDLAVTHGAPWIPCLPEGWSVQRVSQIFENFDYRRVPLNSEERADLEKVYPYYGASGVIDYVDEYIFDEDLILVGEDGANLVMQSTPIAFIASGKYWVNNHAHILKPRHGTLDYWVHALNQIPFELFVTGSAQPKLTAQSLGGIPVAVPDSASLEEATAKIDLSTRNLASLSTPIRASMERLTELRTSLITAAVTGQLDISTWSKRGETERHLETIEAAV